MTKEETIKGLESIEDRAVDFPYMTASDWVANEAIYKTSDVYKEELIDKAVEWLQENIRDYLYAGTIKDVSLIEDFKKYMKGE